MILILNNSLYLIWQESIKALNFCNFFVYSMKNHKKSLKMCDRIKKTLGLKLSTIDRDFLFFAKLSL